MEHIFDLAGKAFLILNDLNVKDVWVETWNSGLGDYEVIKVLVAGDEGIVEQIRVLKTPQGDVSVTGPAARLGGSFRNRVPIFVNVTIQVLVPRGTNLIVNEVSDLVCLGLGGNVILWQGGEDKAKVEDVQEFDVHCWGNSRSWVSGIKGRAFCRVEGRASVDLYGNYIEVNLVVIENGAVVLKGDSQNIKVHADGKSVVFAVGNCQDLNVFTKGESLFVYRGLVSGQMKKKRADKGKILIL